MQKLVKMRVPVLSQTEHAVLNAMVIACPWMKLNVVCLECVIEMEAGVEVLNVMVNACP